MKLAVRSYISAEHLPSAGMASRPHPSALTSSQARMEEIVPHRPFGDPTARRNPAVFQPPAPPCRQHGGRASGGGSSQAHAFGRTAAGQPGGKTPLGLWAQMKAQLAAPPQHVLGFDRPFLGNQVFDLAFIEVAAE